MREAYKLGDLVLPHMDIPDPCPVRILVTDQNVRLKVDRRDWCWDRATGDLVGCGMDVGGLEAPE